MNDIAKRDNTAVGQLADANPFLSYGEAVTHKNIVGELLKYSKGDWLCGQDNTDVPVGTKFIANMDELLIGWIRWQDNKPTDHIMGKVSEGYQIKHRSELGDTDESKWEIDNTGQARDPWQKSNYLLLRGFSDGELYTFTTGSKGGLGAVGDLCKDYGKVIAQRGKEYPVVAIGTSAYDHPNKSFGRIKTPEFKIVGWQPKAVFAPEAGESGEDLEATFDAPVAKPKAAKAGSI